MSPDIASEALDDIYDAAGVWVTHQPKTGAAGKSDLALYQRDGVNIVGGEVVANDHALRFRAGSFDSVYREDRFIVGEITFKVREAPKPRSNGLEFYAALAKA